MDDRTPYEKAVGLCGEDLAAYRSAKKRFGVKDPEFERCVKCGALKLPGKSCIECENREVAERNAQFRAEQLARKEAKNAAGGLLDKVTKKASEGEVERCGRDMAAGND